MNNEGGKGGARGKDSAGTRHDDRSLCMGSKVTGGMANDKTVRDDQVSDRLEWRTEGGRYPLPLPAARLDWPTLPVVVVVGDSSVPSNLLRNVPFFSSRANGAFSKITPVARVGYQLTRKM